jgi:hypothetical protein
MVPQYTAGAEWTKFADGVVKDGKTTWGGKPTYRLKPYFDDQGNPRGYASEMFAEAYGAYLDGADADTLAKSIASSYATDAASIKARQDLGAKLMKFFDRKSKAWKVFR